ncbi:MAG: polysaccharide biosynthesis C-terminal domain-containing protein, partial [Clostridia bacterium]|nr:polysaccharide biosynthesis C-terminal domain-containing protein [Clostridia bacterium]
EQVFKLVLGLIFAKIFLKWGVGFGVFGALLGVSISEFVSLIYLFLLFNKEVKFKFKKLIKNNVLMQDYKIFFKNLLPIALNSVLIPLITAVDSFLIVNLLMASGNSNVEATKMFGIYSGMINSVINFPTIFALSLSVAILPTLAYDYEKNKDLSKISTSFKTIFFVCAPCFLIFTLFAPNIISLLYSTSLSSSDFVLAKILLILSAGNIIFLSFLQFSTSVLQAINKSYISLVNLLLAAVLKVGLTIYLTSSSLGIFGACIASVLCYLFACFLNLNYLTALCSFKQNKNSYLKILFFSVFAVAMMFGLNAAIAKFMNNNLSFIISGVVSAILYLLLTLKFNVFSNNELEKVYLLKKSSKKVNNV